MKDPIRFLHALGRALSALTLYGPDHPSLVRALDAVHEALLDCCPAEGLVLTFLGDEVIVGTEPVRELRGWEWGARLSAAGIQRVEIAAGVERGEVEGWLYEVAARLAGVRADTSEARQLVQGHIRMGGVGISGDTEAPGTDAGRATLDLTLHEEADTMRWLQTEAASTGIVPLLEAEALVRSLSLAMHADQRIILPMLRLKAFDQYTTTHALNVAVLSMALAEHLGCSRSEVRAYGVAGLLHDIGKIRIPIEILTKPGALTPEERALLNRHPVDGARLILTTSGDLDLAAVVAYEHHIMLNGGGYPVLHFPRPCHHASRLVHVCDVYDALRTRRPYRDAWTSEAALAYLQAKAGTEFDPAIVWAFTKMMEACEPRIAELPDEHMPFIAAVAGAESRAPAGQGE
jgi:putative nucleotidyltransferase with HDIG domain